LDIEIKVTNVKPTGRKLKVTWSAEAATDLASFHFRNGPPSTPEESNRLFFLAQRFSEMYPVGSTVHFNASLMLEISEENIVPVTVTSDAVVLFRNNAVAILCSESRDDSDFYYINELVEYPLVVEAIAQDVANATVKQEAL
jgi:hypothetical protein